MIILQTGKKVDSLLNKLSGSRILPVYVGDENVSESQHGGENILHVQTCIFDTLFLLY